MADQLKQIREFPNKADFGDEDLLLIQGAGVTYNVKGTALKQYAEDSAKPQVELAAAQAQAAAQSAKESAASAVRSETAAEHPPMIDYATGLWLVWDRTGGAYVPTDIRAVGKDFEILGYYGTLEELAAAVTSPEPGDAYGVGKEPPYDVYIWDGVNLVWRNNGTLLNSGDMTQSVYDPERKRTDIFAYANERLKEALDADVGRSMAGQTVEPVQGTTVTAGTGAEIFNDYRERTFGTDEGYETVIPTAGNVASGLYAHAEGELTNAQGRCAHAEGAGTTASGTASHAEGGRYTGQGGCVASGYGSHAEGVSTEASNSGSHSEGRGTSASGIGAHAEGVNTAASKDRAHAEGYDTKADGVNSHAEGSTTQAIGQNSHAEGYAGIAEGSAAHVEGYQTEVTETGVYGSHAEGYQTVASGDRGAHAEGRGTTASGSQAHAEGQATRAIGTCAHAEGVAGIAEGIASHVEGGQISGDEVNRATGYAAHAEGASTLSSGEASHAEGSKTTASGFASHAEGRRTIASGSDSHAEGIDTQALGQYSHTSGQDTIAEYYAEVAVGRWNVRKNPSSYNVLGDFFAVGKGTSDTARANAFRVDSSGVYGTSAFNASGADYAERFEWADGNPDGEDRAGLFVTLAGPHIRVAGPEDGYLLGIVSGSPSIVGDVYDDQWKGMYLTDVFGRPLWEDVEVPEVTEERDIPVMADAGRTDEEGNPIFEETHVKETIVVAPAHTERRQKLNPAYDPAQKYIPQSERPEKENVGLLGKLVALEDGSCQVDGWCTAGEGGRATVSAERTRFRVMEKLTDPETGRKCVRVMILNA